LVSGIAKKSNVPIYRRLTMDEQHAVVMRKSSGCPESNGSGTPPSEQGVANPFLMRLAKEFSKSCGGTSGMMVEVDVETLVSLVLLTISMRGETMSGDKVRMSFYRAEKLAQDMGIPKEALEDVFLAVEKHGGRIARGNPMSGMF
jgi:hypothetical protein